MTTEQRKQLVEVAKTLNEHPEVKPIIYFNNCKGVTAFCLAQSVTNAEIEYKHKVDSGVIPATDKVVLHVFPTFTFPTNEASYRPIHTRKCLPNNFMMNEILCKMFGSSIEINFESNDHAKEDDTHLEIIHKKLTRRDSRIYVPFAGDTYERVWYFYSKTKMDDMMDLLLDSAPCIY